MKRPKLGIVTTHPIQYHAPLFKMLEERGEISPYVFYTYSQAMEKSFDSGFNRSIEWDIPLLDGYKYEFVPNVAKNPSTKHRKGIINPSLVERITRINPDILLVFGWNFVSHLKVIRYFSGKKPLLFRGDSTIITNSNGPRRIIKRYILSWIYKHIDYALYVGENNKTYFKEYGLTEHQLVFVPHCIDNERFFDSASKNYRNRAIKWKNDLGIKDVELVLLFAGKFERVKNPFILINAVQEVNRMIHEEGKETNVRLLFAGNGPLEHELKSASEGDPFIQFIPFQNQSQMPLVYRLGNIFVLPSFSETWGLSVNEAMACERPVLVSSSVGCAENLVQENVNGFVFPPSDQHHLIMIIKSLVEKKEELRKMGTESLRIISDWSYDVAARAIETLALQIHQQGGKQ